jgi:hypothetical protein
LRVVFGDAEQCATAVTVRAFGNLLRTCSFMPILRAHRYERSMKLPSPVTGTVWGSNVMVTYMQIACARMALALEMKL